MKPAILECDKNICLYTEQTASRLQSAKSTGIARCVKHGAILTWATWAYGMTIDEARCKRATLKQRQSKTVTR